MYIIEYLYRQCVSLVTIVEHLGYLERGFQTLFVLRTSSFSNKKYIIPWPRF